MTLPSGDGSPTEDRTREVSRVDFEPRGIKDTLETFVAFSKFVLRSFGAPLDWMKRQRFERMKAELDVQGERFEQQRRQRETAQDFEERESKKDIDLERATAELRKLKAAARIAEADARERELEVRAKQKHFDSLVRRLRTEFGGDVRIEESEDRATTPNVVKLRDGLSTTPNVVEFRDDLSRDASGHNNYRNAPSARDRRRADEEPPEDDD